MPKIINLDAFLPPHARKGGKPGRQKPGRQKTQPEAPRYIEPSYRYIPVGVVTFMTACRCDCGATYTAPTYGSHSTFLKAQRTLVRAFGQALREPKHPDPARSVQYTQLHDRRTAAQYPHETVWTHTTLSLCPQCVSSTGAQLPLALDPQVSHVEFATKAHYTHLLSHSEPVRLASGTTDPEWATRVKAYIDEPRRERAAALDNLISLGLGGLLTGAAFTDEG